MELEFQEIEFHAKKFFISVIALYSGSPIVAFLSPIVTFLSPIVTFSSPIVAFSYKFFYRAIFRVPYSGIFKPYSDVLRPYSGVFLQKIFISPIPSSRGPIVAFLSHIVTF